MAVSPAEEDPDRSSSEGLPLIARATVLRGHQGPVLWGTWGGPGHDPVLATGGEDGTVRLWHPSGSPPTLLDGHTSPVRWGAWARLSDGPALVTGALDGARIRHVDPPARSSESLRGGTGVGGWGTYTSTGRASMSDPLLAAGGLDDDVHLWHLRSGGSYAAEVLTGHEARIAWGTWSPTEDLVLATGSDDGSVRVWRMGAGTTRRFVLRGSGGPTRWGAWAADGVLLATGGDDGVVRIWNVSAPERPPKVLEGHRGRIWWGGWTVDGDTPVLATAGEDGTVHLWRFARSGMTTTVLTEDGGGVWWGAWAVLPDGPVLATGGEDGQIRLLRPEDPGNVTRLPGHEGPVRWGAWASLRDGPVLATGGMEGTVRFSALASQRIVERLPTYRSDTAVGRDDLDRNREAAAVAELITARSVLPPLALGLFGDWGEGKSHFLDLVRRQVRRATRPQNALSHTHVRQIRFNAWHYSETDLWSSLVAEMFRQLAEASDDAGAAEEASDPGSAQRQQGRLAAEIIERRRLHERLEGARARLAELLDVQSKGPGPTPEAAAELRSAAERVAPSFVGDVDELYSAAVRGRARVSGQLRIIRSTWSALRPSARAAALFTVAACVIGAVLFTTVGTAWARTVVSLLTTATFLSLAGVFVRRAREAWTQFRKLRTIVLGLAARQRDRLQTAIRVEEAQVAALQRELQDVTAAGQLAGFVSDRADGGDYRSRLGVMTRIREDFEHMADLLTPRAGTEGAHASRDPDGNTDLAHDELPAIDRIVLYIDDLDRCPPPKVVEMLEAVHLLLAVRLFVVVVAVDPRWLVQAVAAHYGHMLHGSATEEDARETLGSDDDLWRASPLHYLEKIFQVVLTLPPLEPAGYRRLLHTLVTVRGEQTVVRPADEEASWRPAVSPCREGRPHSDDDWAGRVPGRPGEPTLLTAPPVVDVVNPLALDPGEVALLEMVGPPLLVNTPRALKRLANSYGLLTALRGDRRSEDLRLHTWVTQADPSRTFSYHPYRAAVVLLGALIAYPSLGPDLFLRLHRAGHERPDLSWAEFLIEQDGRRQGSVGREPDSSPTPNLGQQWEAMLRGLQAVRRRAEDEGLPLPEPLHAWTEWVVPVGRLSYPTGRIVNRLDRFGWFLEAPRGEEA